MSPNIKDFAALISPTDDIDPQWTSIRRAELIGRPVGAKAWIEQLERQSARALSPQNRGPKPKRDKADATASPFGAA